MVQEHSLVQGILFQNVGIHNKKECFTLLQRVSIRALMRITK